jgi:NDP-sugar pyrophosphorylase family protein
MKVVRFCGGIGTRIREYSEAVPKPMTPLAASLTLALIFLNNPRQD